MAPRSTRVSRMSLPQLRQYIRTQTSDIVINGAIGIQPTVQRQKELGDDPSANADATILYSALGSITANYLYYLGGANYWTIAQFDAFGNSGSGSLLGIALGNRDSTGLASEEGALLKGIIKLPATLFSGTPWVGAPIYGSTTLGSYTFTAPSATGNIVKILGYCLNISDDATGITMYFNPDKAWVEV